MTTYKSKHNESKSILMWSCDIQLQADRWKRMLMAGVKGARMSNQYLSSLIINKDE